MKIFNNKNFKIYKNKGNKQKLNNLKSNKLKKGNKVLLKKKINNLILLKIIPLMFPNWTLIHKYCINFYKILIKIY